MVSAVAFCMAVVQLLLWLRDRSNKVPLLAAIISLAAGTCALLEMSIAKTTDIATAQILIFATNVAIFFILVPMVWLIRIYLGHGIFWLAALITAVWLLGLAVNLFLPGNLTYSSITQLEQHVTAWGENWSQPVGTANPFRVAVDVTTLLIIAYVLHATIAAFRSGERRKAIAVGGAVLLFLTVAGIHTILVDEGTISTPYMISWAFVAIAFSLGNEVVYQASTAAQWSRELSQAETRWRMLLENVPLGIMGADRNGTITYANKSFETILGYPKEQLIGSSIVKFAPENLQIELGDRIARAGGTPAQAEFPLVSSRGSIRQVRWSVVSLLDAKRQVSDFIAICEDISELKKAEAELRGFERTIEHFDRAAFLVELSSGLAHELNQPLTAILNNAYAGRRILDRDDTPNEELDEILADIVRDDIRAGKVIESTRRMLQKGKMEVRKSALASLVADVRGILSGETVSAGITIAVNIPDDLPPVAVGRVEIQQVLMNLLLNAIRVLKETHPNKPTICLGAHKKGERVKITISDNGPGIDAKTQARLFEPFFSTRKDGLGMGLPISKRIVELHGGKLECKSDAESGTTFTFSVPVHEPEPQPDHVRETS